MKSTSYDFTPPRIIGALGDESLDPAFARAFERQLEKAGHNAACLPFRVAPRYLKNVIACMQLMDIAGLIVHPAHGGAIARYLTHVEDEAKAVGGVDTVVRRDKGFIGTSAWGCAVNKLVGKQSGSVVVVGRNAAASAAMRLLASRNPARLSKLDAAGVKRIPRGALVIDFSTKPARESVKKTITSSMIEREALSITANLLFSDSY